MRDPTEMNVDGDPFVDEEPTKPEQQLTMLDESERWRLERQLREIAITKNLKVQKQVVWSAFCATWIMVSHAAIIGKEI